MSRIPSSHSRFAWFQTGLFGGAGRGGPGRLVAIGGVLACMAGGAFLLSVRHGNGPPVSQVTKMEPGNLLPGVMDSGEAAPKFQERRGRPRRTSPTPPIPVRPPSTALCPPKSGWGPVASVSWAKPLPPAAAIVTPAPPAYTPPDRPGFDRPAGENEISGARVTKIAAGDGGGDETAEEGKSAREQRQKAIGDLVNSWSSRPPQTTVVIEPASVKQGADDPPALGNRGGARAPLAGHSRKGSSRPDASSTPTLCSRSIRTPTGRSCSRPTRGRYRATG
jgi:intracellular multiplication protein IcmE